jgi:uncharacterized glyoxalase superfamily protein PhnB
VPFVVYPDARAAAAWLCDSYGFVETRWWGPPDDPTVQLAAAGGSVLVRGPRVGHGSARGLRFEPPASEVIGVSLSVQVADVDRHHERAQKVGAEILLPPQTYPFGERQYSTRDPWGHLWTFTESVADVDPATWAQPPGAGATT